MLTLQFFSPPERSKFAHIFYCVKLENLMENLKTTYFKQPRSLYVLAALEFWDRFNFYGMSAVLVLYLIHTLKIASQQATLLYGAYVALAFILPLVGGLLADRWLGFSPSIIIGALALIIGNLFLAIPLTYCLYLGLTLSVFGIGLFKSNVTALVGALYENDQQRESGYTLFYMAMNLGAIAGPIAFALLIKEFSWRICFIVISILMTGSLILFLKHRNQLPLQKLTKVKKSSVSLFIIVLALSILLVTALFYYPYLANGLVVTLAIVALGGIVVFSLRRATIERQQLLFLLFLCILSALFFAAELQTNSTLILFIDNFVDHRWFGINIPPSFFSSVEPFFILVFAPICARFWRRTQKNLAMEKILLGLLFASTSFFLFSIASLPSLVKHTEQIILIVGGIACLGLGEVLLAPAIMATIARLAPPKMLGTLMGVWFLALALTSELAALLATMATKTHFNTSTSDFHHSFMITGGLMLIICNAMFLLQKTVLYPFRSLAARQNEI